MDFEVGSPIFFCGLCCHMRNGNHTEKCGRCMQIQKGPPTQYEPRPIEESMMKLQKRDCIILPLVLKKKWYDMIKSGVKRQEYRTSKKVCHMIERWVGHWHMNKGQKKLVVTFFLGYQKDRPSMSYLVDYVTYAEESRHPDWGEPEGLHCVIDLSQPVSLGE